MKLTPHPSTPPNHCPTFKFLQQKALEKLFAKNFQFIIPLLKKTLNTNLALYRGMVCPAFCVIWPANGPNPATGRHQTGLHR